MTFYKSRLGSIAVAVYLIALFAAIVYLFDHYTETKFAGLFLVALTFPWSFVISLLLSSTGVIKAMTLTTRTLLLIIGAVPNGIFLYWIWAKIEDSFRKKN